MNIVLIGYRGSGKSTIGKKLADRLWKDFADLDEHTRARFEHAPIAQIWQTHGEPAFREAEAETAIELLARDDMVIALGGGSVMHERTRQALAEATDTRRIYLYCEPEELHRRIAADPATEDERPRLTGHDDALQEIRQVLDERDPIYREVADAVFEVTHVNPDQALQYLLAKYV